MQNIWSMEQYPQNYFSVYSPYQLEYMTLYEKYCSLEINYKQIQTENKRLKNQITQIKIQRQKQIQKRKNRRSFNQLNKQYKCPYNRCHKIYASDLAQNLHIRTKHNGGTKTQRQNLARKIILAEQKGEPMPQINLNFPPNFMEVQQIIMKEFRSIFFGKSSNQS